MNRFKHHVQSRGVRYLMTYADNFAVGYFRRLGFSETITWPRTHWDGYIKDYEGATLMGCPVLPELDYLTLPALCHEFPQLIREGTECTT